MEDRSCCRHSVSALCFQNSSGIFLAARREEVQPAGTAPVFAAANVHVRPRRTLPAAGTPHRPLAARPRQPPPQHAAGPSRPPPRARLHHVPSALLHPEPPCMVGHILLKAPRLMQGSHHCGDDRLADVIVFSHLGVTWGVPCSLKSSASTVLMASWCCQSCAELLISDFEVN